MVLSWLLKWLLVLISSNSSMPFYSFYFIILFFRLQYNYIIFHFPFILPNLPTYLTLTSFKSWHLFSLINVTWVQSKRIHLQNGSGTWGSGTLWWREKKDYKSQKIRVFAETSCLLCQKKKSNIAKLVMLASYLYDTYKFCSNNFTRLIWTEF